MQEHARNLFKDLDGHNGDAWTCGVSVHCLPARLSRLSTLHHWSLGTLYRNSCTLFSYLFILAIHLFFFKQSCVFVNFFLMRTAARNLQRTSPNFLPWFALFSVLVNVFLLQRSMFTGASTRENESTCPPPVIIEKPAFKEVYFP